MTKTLLTSSGKKLNTTTLGLERMKRTAKEVGCKVSEVADVLKDVKDWTIKFKYCDPNSSWELLFKTEEIVVIKSKKSKQNVCQIRNVDEVNWREITLRESRKLNPKWVKGR